MKRRQFLRGGLALGAATLLPGVGISASNWLPSGSVVPVVEMTFSELIRNEEAILERLLVASLLQRELVRDGNIDVLIQHLEQRQQLWNEFELLERQLTPHKQILLKQRVWKSAEEHQTTKAALNRCKELLDRILENDQICLAIGRGMPSCA
jgi:hypothetical protein